MKGVCGGIWVGEVDGCVVVWGMVVSEEAVTVGGEFEGVRGFAGGVKLLLVIEVCFVQYGCMAV